MYSVIVDTLEIRFVTALIAVAEDGSDHDWLSEKWVDVPQQIKIVQAEGWATVTGLTGYAAAKGDHVIRPLEPAAYTEHEVIEYLLNSAAATGLPRVSIAEAVETTQYQWGILVSLNWTTLGYAPGGSEHCMLPTLGRAVSLGHLCLEWATVEVYEAM